MNGSNFIDNQQINNTDSSVSMLGLIYRLLDKAVLMILAAVLGAFIMGMVYRSSSINAYTSTSKLYLSNMEDETSFVSNIQAMNYMVLDYFEVFQTKEIHQRVSKEAGLNYTADQLGKMVTAENIEGTHIISITVNAKTPQEAELLANTYADVAGSLIEEKLNVPRPKLFESATPAAESFTSTLKAFYIIGAMCGLLISCVAVVLFAAFDDRVYTPEDLQSAAGIETLGIMTKQTKKE